jgi:hypothetical protein
LQQASRKAAYEKPGASSWDNLGKGNRTGPEIRFPKNLALRGFQIKRANSVVQIKALRSWARPALPSPTDFYQWLSLKPASASALQRHENRGC